MQRFAATSWAGIWRFALMGPLVGSLILLIYLLSFTKHSGWPALLGFGCLLGLPPAILAGSLYFHVAPAGHRAWQLLCGGACGYASCLLWFGLIGGAGLQHTSLLNPFALIGLLTGMACAFAAGGRAAAP